MDNTTTKPDEELQPVAVDPATEPLPDVSVVEPSQSVPEPNTDVPPPIEEPASETSPPALESVTPEPLPDPIESATVPEPAGIEPPLALPLESSNNETVTPTTSLPPEAITAPLPAPLTPVGGIPASVLALSNDELRLAATYYLQKNQASISQKGVQARQTAMQKNLDAITAYIQSHSNSQIPHLARKLNLSPGLTSHYLQILVKQGRIKANGHAKSRHYFI